MVIAEKGRVQTVAPSQTLVVFTLEMSRGKQLPTPPENLNSSRPDPEFKNVNSYCARL